MSSKCCVPVRTLCIRSHTLPFTAFGGLLGGFVGYDPRNEQTGVFWRFLTGLVLVTGLSTRPDEPCRKESQVILLRTTGVRLEPQSGGGELTIDVASGGSLFPLRS